MLLAIFWAVSKVKVTFSQGVTFKTNQVKSAISEAKRAGQPVMIYFRMEGIESCMQLEKTFFADSRARDCFSKFACCLVDVKKNQALAMEYGVQVVPTVIMLNNKGKLAYRMEGNMAPAYLVYLGKSLSGIKPSLEELYEKYMENKKDLSAAQNLLHDAFYFLYYLPVKERSLWEQKLMKIYEEYVKKKPLEGMVNAKDFFLLTSYDIPSKENREFDFLVANADRFREVVDGQKVISYLINTNNDLIQKLAREGDLGYEKCLERIKGDMAELYKNLKGPGDVYTLLKMDADALYLLYGKKDQNAYVAKRGEYFKGLGEALGVEDLLRAVQELSMTTKGKITQNAADCCLAWLDVIDVAGVEPEMKVNLLIVRADCYLSCKDNVKAKGCLNEAYLLAMQAGITGLQQYIKQKINAVGE